MDLKSLALVVLIVHCARVCSEQCSSPANYWAGNLLWYEDIRCNNSSSCQQVKLAFFGDSIAIDLSQNLNSPQPVGNYTPLIVASHLGHLHVVELLLANGASAGLDMQDSCGWSALMHASFTGHGDIVKLLLESGTNINLVNGDGRNALMLASVKGHVRIVQLLLKYSTDTKAVDIWNLSALKLAVYGVWSCHPDVVRVLLEECDNSQYILEQALWEALDHCCPTATEDLLRYGAPHSNLDQLLGAVGSSPNENKHSPRCLEVRTKLMRSSLDEIDLVQCPGEEDTTTNEVACSILIMLAVVFLLSILCITAAVIVKKCRRDKDGSRRHGSKPTMPELYQFDIPREIGVHFREVGTLLLQDKTGSLIDAIAFKHHNNPYAINEDILKRWISGEGLRPTSWETLSEVIRDCKMAELANIIDQYHMYN